MESVKFTKKQLRKYLLSLRGDIYKLLPMKEAEMGGSNNHLYEYIDSLIVNMKGATITFPSLECQKQFLYVLNNLQFIKRKEVPFDQWRTIVLGSGTEIYNLYIYFGGQKREQ